MRRRLFNLAAGVSLVLCFATVALWVRSYRIPDALRLQVRRSTGANVEDRTFYLGSVQGRLVLSSSVTFLTHDPARIELDFPDHVGFAWRPPRSPWLAPRSTVDQFRVVRIGSGWRAVPGGRTKRAGLAFPLALLPLLAMVLPLRWWVWRRRAALRLQRDRCSCCGYDLRATPDRCPECGSPNAQPRH
jgi:hypothetical protein